MKKFKSISFVLMFCLLLGSALASLKSPQEKNEEVREALEKAKQYIYEKNWEDAVARLENMIKKNQENRYLDESLYWLGYSMQKLSRELNNMNQQIQIKQQAVEHLNTLIQELDQSSWVNDAKLLRIEIAEELVKKGHTDYKEYINGTLGIGVEGGVEGGVLGGVQGGVSGGIIGVSEDDPEMALKLVALDALMNMEEDKAFSILKEVINKNENPRIRKRAVFIISQGDNPELIPLLIKLAKNDSDKEIRNHAVFWLGQKRTKQSLDALIDLYDSVSDTKVKESLIFALHDSGSQKAWKKLMEIARNEKDMALRKQAVFWIGERKTPESLDFLLDFYFKVHETEFKKSIIFQISQKESKKAVENLIRIAKKEKDPELKKHIIFWLGQSEDEAAVEYLKEIINKR